MKKRQDGGQWRIKLVRSKITKSCRSLQRRRVVMGKRKNGKISREEKVGLETKLMGRERRGKEEKCLRY